MTNNVLYLSDGDYGTPGGYLLPLVQGQYGQSVPLEILDLAGNVVPLTGYSTITGHKRKGGSVTALVGTFTLSGTPTVAPQITWVIDEDDTGQDGAFSFFLEITNGSIVYTTHPVSLTIVKDPAVNATAAPGLVSVTTAQKALLATIAGLSGLVKMAGGVASAILIKLDGTAAPTVNDDSGDGYTVGSIWVDTTNDNAYICTDATLGAANWEQINGGGGSGDLLAANNLSELAATAATARGNIGAAAATNLLSHESATTFVHGITNTAALLTTSAIGSTVQAYSAKTAAIAALTWAANSIILLTGTTTASVQALAAHIVTLLQSADAAGARTAILAADSRPTQTDIAGTTHTFTTANEGQIVASQSGSATVFTVPLNSAQAFTVGSIVGVERQGAGTLAITATSGVTLNGVDGASKSISTQWAAAALRKVGTNAWVIIGTIS